MGGKGERILGLPDLAMMHDKMEAESSWRVRGQHRYTVYIDEVPLGSQTVFTVESPDRAESEWSQDAVNQQADGRGHSGDEEESYRYRI